MKAKCIVQHIGDIEVKDGLVVVDPCMYPMSLGWSGFFLGKDDMEDGAYSCYAGWIDTRYDGKRIAVMEMVKNTCKFKITAREKIGSVYIDSGFLMAGNIDEWKKHHHGSVLDEKWYWGNVVDKCDEMAHIEDGNLTYLCNTGYGDGEYPVFGDRKGPEKKLYRIMAQFIEPADGYEIMKHIGPEEKPDFGE